MNYQHHFHAGNFADVFKHILLITLLKSFLKKETSFCYIDTHAGAGLYDLHTKAPHQNKEHQNGIQKILAAKTMPLLIKEYVEIINQFSHSIYPGSPKIAQAYLRPNDRMILCEMNSREYRTLKSHFSHAKNTALLEQNGYHALNAFLPPKEKRGLILIDPPYEKNSEFSDLISSLTQAVKKFETGIYAIWYPIKNRADLVSFYRNIQEKIQRKIMICEFSIYPDDLPTHLNGNGMIIINPPFQLDDQLNEILPWLWETLSINRQGGYVVKTIN